MFVQLTPLHKALTSRQSPFLAEVPSKLSVSRDRPQNGNLSFPGDLPGAELLSSIGPQYADGLLLGCNQLATSFFAQVAFAGMK